MKKMLCEACIRMPDKLGRTETSCCCSNSVHSSFDEVPYGNCQTLAKKQC